MAFAKDRDLLALEPRLFEEVPWLGQRLFSGDLTVVGTAAAGVGIDFMAAGVEAGMVVSVGGAGYEIASVVNNQTLAVSVLRADPAGALIPPLAASGPAVVTTFVPQLGVVHGQLLRRAGVEPGSAEAGAVTNGAGLALVEALGALHLVYSAASASGQGAEGWAERSEMYRRRFAAERRRARVLLDLDGDGEAEVERRLSTAWFTRA
ncbi:MAG: hypothetical protein AAF108_00780 [Planctomycetota bacterium]